MKRMIPIVFLFLAPLLLGACATGKASRDWSPGDTIICPHCGRGFPVPEKLGR